MAQSETPSAGKKFWRLGLPPAEELKAYRIWDSYFLPSAARQMEEIEETLPVLELAAIERLCLFLSVGLEAAGETSPTTSQASASALAPLQRWPDRLLGMIQLNANQVQRSLEAIDRWLGDGPMVGVYFPGGGPAALSCSDRNYRPLIERIIDVGGVIMQHTWFKTGGKQHPGESTPSELAGLAKHYPEQAFIAAHAGGEWEKGIRAVRASPNILVETSGFDPTAGFMEMAVRELGAERIVFGSHLPSRSLGTELGKVLGADLTFHQRQQVLGANFRKLLIPILQAKGLPG